jgi:hypothetical protein
VEIARILNAMSAEQLASLGISEWDRSEAYDRVERLFISLCRVLEERPVVDGVEVDAAWFANRIMTAAIPARFKTSSSVAVDGTDVETWGALHGDCATVELDGEAAETQLMDEIPTKPRAVRKARVLGVGPDGRKQYTGGPRRPGRAPLRHQHPVSRTLRWIRAASGGPDS